MPNVLHILPSLSQSYGGPLAAVLDLCEWSVTHGMRSEILGFGQIDIPDHPFPRNQMHTLRLGSFESYCYSPSLRRWLRENLMRFDGVVLHGMWLYPNWAAAQECRRAGVPYACFPHGMLDRWSVFGQGRLRAVKKTAYWLLREREVFAGAVATLFTTRREAHSAAATFRLPTVPSIIVPLGASIANERVQDPSSPERTIVSGEKSALFLGRIHPKKGVDFLLRCWASAALPAAWKLLIAGPGDPAYLSELALLAEHLGIANQVRFLGMVSGPDKSYLFQHADWFLLPSQQENFGVAVLEAIRHGCAPAVSDQVYISEYFPKEAEVLPLTERAWVEFLRSRMQNPSRRQRIVEANRLHMEPLFNTEKIAAGWTSALTQAFGTGTQTTTTEPCIQ